MSRFITILCLVFISVITTAQTITIYAASDLRYAMDEVIVEFKKQNPSISVKVTYGSSGIAFQQLQNGAPYDMFFSADIMYAQKLYELGLTQTKPVVYAIGKIVLWSSQKQVIQGLKFLDNTTLKIAVANPAHAPYGKRAVECLQYYRKYEQVKNQLIYAENIAQAAQYCLTNNAEVGIIAYSLALSPSMINKGYYYIIPQKSYSQLQQAYVIMKQAQKASFVFSKWVQSPQSKKIFKKYGFT